MVHILPVHCEIVCTFNVSALLTCLTWNRSCSTLEPEGGGSLRRDDQGAVRVSAPEGAGPLPDRGGGQQ